MSQSIEGIDYIFNRYAFLGLPIEANEKDIHTEIRKKRAENHPDKLLRVSKNITDLANRNIELIDQCERILLNFELKSLYDIKLKEFLDKEPHLVSDNGIGIIDLSKMKIDLSYLLNEPIRDMNDLQALAKKMSGYNEKRLKKSQISYEEEVNEENRESLREELTNKVVYLNLIEEYYWQKAGISNVKNPTHTYQNSSDVIKSFENNIELIKEKASEVINNQHGLALLGFVKPLLITYEGATNQSEISANIIYNKVIEAFQLRSNDVKKVIEEKEQTLEELVKVSRSKQIVQSDKLFHDFLLFSSITEPSKDYVFPEDNIQLAGLAFRLDLETNTLDLINLDFSVLTKEIINTWENNLHIVEPNNEIEAPILEIVSLANRISEEYVKLK